MKRTIESLNGLSFSLPVGYKVVREKYFSQNDMGLFHKENYVSKDMKVISFFEINQNADLFLEKYGNLTCDKQNDGENQEVKKQVSLNIDGRDFTAFVIKTFHQKLIYIFQVFVKCDDGLGCFMINLDRWNDDIVQLAKDNQLLDDLLSVLRSIK